MTKAGDKILAGAREVVAALNGDPDVIENMRITGSCGCPFCDLGFRPANGMHHMVGRSVRCPREER